MCLIYFDDGIVVVYSKSVFKTVLKMSLLNCFGMQGQVVFNCIQLFATKRCFSIVLCSLPVPRLSFCICLSSVCLSNINPVGLRFFFYAVSPPFVLCLTRVRLYVSVNYFWDPFSFF